MMHVREKLNFSLCILWLLNLFYLEYKGKSFVPDARIVSLAIFIE